MYQFSFFLLVSCWLNNKCSMLFLGFWNISSQFVNLKSLNFQLKIPFLSLQNSSKSFSRSPRKASTRCSSKPTAWFTSKTRTCLATCSTSWKDTMREARSIWPRRWTRSSTLCTRRCLQCLMLSTSSMISKWNLRFLLRRFFEI